ncbi:MAG: bifunctional UDP-3-O-[3-hydroxymyristoyl] N-acetylglucosamine deacetylase/3-hydroxyacyl-ACP dehydratase [Bacteroidetes bacterium]|nr:bifunctional UDP-3-O-[3-hydroxymyristoyl] N-acetylglucosamine deacetylase/3-hydroxyacyl-ACP dehydratase [Bacteroidota bacterium]
MPELQQTLKKKVTIAGRGIHSGEYVTLNLLPADENTGIVFRRIDLDGQPQFQADVDLVVDVERGTTLNYNGIKIATVEHLLAALTALEVDNTIIELDGEEIPILDGSSMPFVELIEEAGIQEQKKPREYFVLEETFNYYDPVKDVEMMAVPNDHYNITVMIDYNSNVLGRQFAQLKRLSQFKSEFASARTFCFLHEVEPLLKEGLIKGGDLGNALVIADEALDDESMLRLSNKYNIPITDINTEGIINDVDLRHNNEPARHKLIDVIGDLALIGMPIKGKIFASKPGHATNVEFARQLKQYIKEKKKLKEIPTFDPNKEPVISLEEIKQLLPHRYPFLLLDKVVEITDEHIIGIKNVTINEPFFPGHFPEDPIMPGVLQIEAMAQTGGVMVLKRKEDPHGYMTYFLKIEECKFKQPVRPGDTMVIKMSMIGEERRGINQMHGMIYVGNKLVTEAKMMAKVFKP